jgi:hypothetical protein
MPLTGIAILLKSYLTGEPGCNAGIQNSYEIAGVDKPYSLSEADSRPSCR